jgi:hypothetical protein
MDYPVTLMAAGQFVATHSQRYGPMFLPLCGSRFAILPPRVGCGQQALALKVGFQWPALH